MSARPHSKPLRKIKRKGWITPQYREHVLLLCMHRVLRMHLAFIIINVSPPPLPALQFLTRCCSFYHPPQQTEVLNAHFCAERETHNHTQCKHIRPLFFVTSFSGWSALSRKNAKGLPRRTWMVALVGMGHFFPPLTVRGVTWRGRRITYESV